jgi:cytidylate kinase
MNAPSVETYLVAEAAERQMRRQVIVEQVAQRISESLRHPQQMCQHHFVAISREAGTGGAEVASRVGQALGWKVLDRNLLEQMAARSGVPLDLLEIVDDGYPGWFFEAFACWFDRRLVTQSRYLIYLKTVLRETLKQENVVIVGRGAQFLLPRECGLAVRLIAPEPYRIEQMRARHGLSYYEARQMVRRLDAERRRFLKLAFGEDSDNPYIYDMILNVEKTGIDGAAKLVVAAVQQWLLPGNKAT